MTRFCLRSVVPIVRALPPALLLAYKALHELTTRLAGNGLAHQYPATTGRLDPDAGWNLATRQLGHNPTRQQLDGCRAARHALIGRGN